MPTMGNVLGLIFANMHDGAIHDLTKVRTMGSVPFGGRYRFIDFTLSNMVNSGISEIGVITKANYQSLIDHLGSGREWDLTRKKGGLHILPPYGQVGSGMYRGRLEALGGVINFIRHSSAEYVILSDCDVIASMNFKEIIKAHEESGADITTVYSKTYYNSSDNSSKTVLNLDENNIVREVLINPSITGLSNVSLNIFILEKKFLETIVADAIARNLYSFEVDILQHKINEFDIRGYEHNGHLSQIDSMLEFYEANMNLLRPDIRQELFSTYAPIYTKIRDESPAKYGINSSVKNSLIADGCIIEGEVENSILFRGVIVNKGATIRNSIIMQGTEVGGEANIDHVITDKNVIIGDSRMLSGSPQYPVFIGKKAVV
mgnify:FL=1